MSLTENSSDLSKRPLPEGWRWVRLGDVCENNIETRNPKAEPDKPFIYIDISSIDNCSKKIIRTLTLLGSEAPSRARRVIRLKDVLVSTTRPNLNAVAIVSQELDNQICSTGFCVLRAKKEIDPFFLFAFVRSPQFVQKVSDLVKGALYPAVTDKQIFDISIPLPPLSEQKRIAAVLNEQMAAIEKARAASEEQLEAAKALPGAYLREVFESDEAKKWPRKKLGDVCKTTSGGTPPRGELNYYGGNIPWIKSGELNDGYIYSASEKITDEAVKKSSAKIFPPGTLLIALYGATVGKLGILQINAATNQAVCAIFVGDNIHRDFLFYYLLKIRKSLLEASFGGAQPNISQRVVRKILIPLPPLSEQKRIANYLLDKITKVQQLQKTLEDQLEAIKALQQAILRKAFAGDL